MKLELHYQKNHTNPWAVLNIFDKIHMGLERQYKEIKFQHVPMHTTSYYGINTAAVFSIINPKNNKRIIISYMDSNRCILSTVEQLGWYPELIQQVFITSEYTNIIDACKLYNSTNINDRLQYFRDMNNEELLFFHNPNKVFKPFTYPVYDKNFDNWVKISSKLNRSAKERKQKLLFRGFLWQPRQTIMKYIHHKEISCTEEKLNEIDYIAYLQEYRCGISLNGQAEICNRDIEYMAVGIPIIRPTLKHTETHEPLIPNKHYIAFDYERHPSHESAYFGAPQEHNLKLISDALVARWEEVKKDYDFLEYIGENAKQWYLNYGKDTQHVQLFLSKVNLNLLL
jgi:hypothetical protein